MACKVGKIPRSFSDLSSILVPLDSSLLLAQLASELCILKLSNSLISELPCEVSWRLANNQLSSTLVISNHGSVLALIFHGTVFDSQGVFESISSVDNAFAECHLLAGLHPSYGHLRPVHFTNKADSLLLLSLNVFNGLQEFEFFLCEDQWKITESIFHEEDQHR